MFICLFTPASHRISIGRHEAYYESVHDQTIRIPNKDDAITILAHERVYVEVSHKVNRSLALSEFLFTLYHINVVFGR